MADQNAGIPSHEIAPGRSTLPVGTSDGVAGRTAPVAKPTTKAKSEHAPAETKDGWREIVETVVFVVVLVLLLKSFVAEAFVIPTGSMAETLYGYQKLVTCPECGHVFPVNASGEADPQNGQPLPVERCTCPNCLKQIEIHDHTWNSGDRVLV